MFVTTTLEKKKQAATGPINKLRQRSMSQTRQPDCGSDDWARALQPNIGNLATPPHPSRWGLSPATKDHRAEGLAAENKTPAEVPPRLVWSFSKISIFAAKEANRQQTPSRLVAPPSPEVMQQGFAHKIQASTSGDIRSALGEFDTKNGTGRDERDPVGGLTTAPPKTAANLAPSAHKPPTPGTHTTPGKANHALAARPKVTLPPQLRASTTPTEMADRIPPRRVVQVSVGIADLPKGATPVEVSVGGSGGGNGSVTVDGAATATLVESTMVTLQGETQTDKGKGSNLRLVAKQGAVNLAQSKPFSVSSVPQNFDETLFLKLTGNERGIVVQDDWSSDSGPDSKAFSDLNLTSITEVVERGAATGCFAGVAFQNSSELAGNEKSKDTHNSAVSDLTSAGEITATQASVFTDLRTGSSHVPMTNSGYIVTRKNEASSNGKYKITTSKRGEDVTVKGITTKAGATSKGPISVTQEV